MSTMSKGEVKNVGVKPQTFRYNDNNDNDTTTTTLICV